MGNTPAEIRDINWREFVQRKPFSRYTLPVYSLVGRDGVDQACRSIYGDVDIADLWIPFFCTSCDLHTGNKVMHLRGPMWKAARASTSLPGIVPPVVDGARLLVDGGVLDNVPEEEMARFCEGRVLAVEVSPGKPVHPGFDYEDMPSPWQVLWSRLNPLAHPHQIPRLREILMRTATMANVGQAGRLEDIAELVLRPPVSHYGMLDFPAIDAIIADSIPYTREVLRGWLKERRA
jgi:predicted acylesterase/phospholipase RssA